MGLINNRTKQAIDDSINESREGFHSSYLMVRETVEIDTDIIAEEVTRSDRVQAVIKEGVTNMVQRALAAAITRELSVTLRENAADFSTDDVSWAQECVEGAMTELVDATLTKVAEVVEAHVNEAVNLILVALNENDVD